MSDYLKHRQQLKLGIAKPADTNREKELKEYAKQSKIYRKAHPECEIKSPNCTGKTEGVHHCAGKIGPLLLDKKFWKPSCNNCNSWIEANSAEAKRLGLKVTKHQH